MSEDFRIFKDYWVFKDDPQPNQVPLKGTSTMDIRITRLNMASNLLHKVAYQVAIKQRVAVIPHAKPAYGSTNKTSYDNYPAILCSRIRLKPSGSKKTVILEEIFPRTINASVNTSSSADSASSESNASGSSDTNTNSFSASLSAGFFGPLPTGGISASASHSHSHTSESSHQKSTSTGMHNGTDMSVKDWASTSSYLHDDFTAQWCWSQVFPWDVMKYNKTVHETEVTVPNSVINRLFDLKNKIAYRPSELSLFGIDFTMAVKWLLICEEAECDDSISVELDVACHTATHRIETDKPHVYVQGEAQSSHLSKNIKNINLVQYALIPIDPHKCLASIIFKSAQFLIPIGGKTPFQVISKANNLEVKGTGFDKVMSTNFSSDPSLTVFFKISDTDVEYSLLLMHWVDKENSTCKLKWKVNGQWSGEMAVSSKSIDNAQDNVSVISLRNNALDIYKSHDYLALGANTIQIDIVHEKDKSDFNYNLLALSIEKS